MSFIYENDQLVKLLLEAGDNSIKKQAQTGALPDDKINIVKAIPDYELALKLLYNLQRDLGDPSAPAAGVPIGVEGNPNAEVSASTAHFRTLGDFLGWAAANKLTWKGKRFAWTPEEVAAKRGVPGDPTQDAWVFTSLPFDRNDRRLDRQPEEKSVYADKDALVAYLSALRDSPEAKQNNVLRFMLASLIGETNGYLRIKGETPISTKPSDKPQDNLDPRLIIDMVPSVLSMETVNEGIDNHPFQNANPDSDNALTVNDLKDEGSFKSWLRNKKVKVTTPANGKQPAQTVVVGATDSNGDPCTAVHVLYKRALLLRNVAAGDDQTVPNYSKGVALYLLAVTNFGRTLVDPKTGQACAVVTPGTTTATPGTAAPGAGGTDSAGKGSATQMLNNVVSYMPLRLGSINVNDIDAFFRAYEKIITPGTELERAVKEHHAQVSTSKLYLDKMLINYRYDFPLSGGAESVVKWLSDPRKSYNSFVQHIMLILENTLGAINLFYNSYAVARSGEDRAIFTPEQKSIVAGQLQIAQSNKAKLQEWEYATNSVQGIKK